MKTRQIFIVFIIILLATTLLYPKTAEQKYCDQFSGESKADVASENFDSCQTDARCTIDQDSIKTKEVDHNEFLFSCVPAKLK